MSKVCIFIATGYEEIEALTVVNLLRRAGIEISMVSISGERSVVGSHAIQVKMDKIFDEVDFATVDMIVLPGGMPGTKNLEEHKPLMQQLDDFYEQGKMIAAICAAPSILGHRGMLQGKKACAFPGFENDLIGAEVTLNPVETVNNIITARGMGCAIDFGLAIIEKLEGKNKAEELADQIIYSHYKW